MVLLLNNVKLCQKVLIFFSANKNNQVRIINLIKAEYLHKQFRKESRFTNQAFFNIVNTEPS